MFKIGVIGAGNMGMAIANGMVSKEIFKACEICVCDKSTEKLSLAREKGFGAFEDEKELYKNSETVITAVKPQNYEKMITSLAETKSECGDRLIITIAAGISISYIQKFMGETARVIRVMPNTPLMIGEGASVLSKSGSVSEKEFMMARQIFSAMGVAEVMPEEMINVSTAVNGSGPAYFYYVVEAMTKAAVAMGMDEEKAIVLAAKTMEGAAKMILKGEKTPEKLRIDVSSPGGTTLEALHVFDEHKMDDIIVEAMKACKERAAKLGK